MVSVYDTLEKIEKLIQAIEATIHFLSGSMVLIRTSKDNLKTVKSVLEEIREEVVGRGKNEIQSEA